jgi:hypothetical protein
VVVGQDVAVGVTTTPDPTQLRDAGLVLILAEEAAGRLAGPIDVCWTIRDERTAATAQTVWTRSA